MAATAPDRAARRPPEPRVPAASRSEAALRDRGLRRGGVGVGRRPAGEPPRRHAARHPCAGAGETGRRSTGSTADGYGPESAARRHWPTTGSSPTGATAAPRGRRSWERSPRRPGPSDDGRTYVFTLRPGLRYSDGTPVRPEDFRASIERFLQVTRTASASPPYFAGIVGAERCMRASGALRPLRRGSRPIPGRARSPSTSRIRTRSSCTSSRSWAYVVPAGTPRRRVGDARRPAPGRTASPPGTPGDGRAPGPQPVLPRSPQDRPAGFADRIEVRSRTRDKAGHEQTRHERRRGPARRRRPHDLGERRRYRSAPPARIQALASARRGRSTAPP